MKKFVEIKQEQSRAIGEGVAQATLMNVIGASGSVGSLTLSHNVVRGLGQDAAHAAFTGNLAQVYHIHRLLTTHTW